MTLDHEDQRAILISLIDAVPVSGPMAQVSELISRVAALRAAIVDARIDIDPALDAYRDR